MLIYLHWLILLIRNVSFITGQKYKYTYLIYTLNLLNEMQMSVQNQCTAKETQDYEDYLIQYGSLRKQGEMRLKF